MTSCAHIPDTGLARRLRVILIGAGAIAQSKYLPALRKLHDTYAVAAVVDPGRQSRAFVAACFPGAIDLTELPDDPAELGDIDVALVLTPPTIRPAYIERCLGEGLHVLAEKPLALTAGEAMRLRDVATSAERSLVVAHTRRHDPGYPLLRRSLADCEVISASASTLETPYQAVVDLASHQLDLEPGLEFDRSMSRAESELISDAIGSDDARAIRYYRWVLIESLVHDLDLLTDVLGRAQTVECCRYFERGIGVAALLRFKHAVATLDWTLAPGLGTYDQVFSFTGAASRHRLRYPSAYLVNATAELSVDTAGPEPSGNVQTHTVASREDAFTRLLRYVADLVRRGESTQASAGDAIEALVLAEALSRSAVAREPVSLEGLRMASAGS